MTSYLCSWQIDIEADSPQDAADQAQAIFHDAPADEDWAWSISHTDDPTQPTVVVRAYSQEPA